MPTGEIRDAAEYRSSVPVSTERISQLIDMGNGGGTAVRDYADTMNVHILPHFGNMNIEDITWRDVQRFYNKYQDRAFSTLNRWHLILSRILKIAVGDEIIPIDPTKDSRLTHSRKKIKRPVPTKQEFKQILDEIPNLKRQHEMLYMALICYTSLRKGEVLVLHRDDIDFVYDKIHVTKATQTRKTSKKNPGKIQKQPYCNGPGKTPVRYRPRSQRQVKEQSRWLNLSKRFCLTTDTSTSSL